MQSQAKFFNSNPGAFFLDENDRMGIQLYLSDKKILEPGETILSVEKAGQGNMNCVLRFHTSFRTFILRQARPWIEKLPEQSAPASRMDNEVNFYTLVSSIPSWKVSIPQIYFYDKRSCLTVMEDLGAGKDYSWIYQKGEAAPIDEMTGLSILLSSLHRKFQNSPKEIMVQNSEVVEYLSASLFVTVHPENFPEQNDAALENERIKMINDKGFIHQMAELRDIFRNDTACIQHGDFSPGSWLRTENGMFVIDPEFAFWGPVEFDMGIFLAHLILSDQHPDLLAAVIRAYHPTDEFSQPLMWKFSSVEIIRRIFGQQQLPHWNATPEEKMRMLNNAREMLG